MKLKHSAHTLGELLIEVGIVTQDQLDNALEVQANGDDRPIGVLLVELGYVMSTEIDETLVLQKARRGSLNHEDGIRLLDEAVQCTRRATSCIDDLVVAAEELESKAKG